MRILLILWLGPIVLLTAWYGLSYHDMNFGTVLLSRELHDLMFNLYGKILGVAPEAIPLMVAKAIAFDSLLVVGIIAYRMRKRWWPTVRGWFSPESAVSATGQGSPAE